MYLLEEIRQAWGWVGIDPTEVVRENDFGNLIIKDIDGKYWRLCPEDCYCKIIADDREALNILSTDPEFLRDWHMSELVSLAKDKLGPLSEGRKYCLKIPGVLGGAYGGDNLATVPLIELIGFSAYIAKQIKDVPDGTPYTFKIED